MDKLTRIINIPVHVECWHFVLKFQYWNSGNWWGKTINLKVSAIIKMLYIRRFKFCVSGTRMDDYSETTTWGNYTSIYYYWGTSHTAVKIKWLRTSSQWNCALSEMIYCSYIARHPKRWKSSKFTKLLFRQHSKKSHCHTARGRLNVHVRLVIINNKIRQQFLSS